jgi:hypothetical protein
MNKRKKWLITVTVLLFIAGALYAWDRYNSYHCCTPRPITIGEFNCVYDTALVPARIVDVWKDSTHVRVKLSVTRADGRIDSVYLERQPPYIMLSRQNYEASGLREGDSIACRHLTIRSGDCSPETFWFAWEKFVATGVKKTKKHSVVH